jgi:hypothetical protein
MKGTTMPKKSETLTKGESEMRKAERPILDTETFGHEYRERLSKAQADKKACDERLKAELERKAALLKDLKQAQVNGDMALTEDLGQKIASADKYRVPAAEGLLREADSTLAKVRDSVNAAEESRKLEKYPEYLATLFAKAETALADLTAVLSEIESVRFELAQLGHEPSQLISEMVPARLAAVFGRFGLKSKHNSVIRQTPLSF